MMIRSLTQRWHHSHVTSPAWREIVQVLSGHFACIDHPSPLPLAGEVGLSGPGEGKRRVKCEGRSVKTMCCNSQTSHVFLQASAAPSRPLPRPTSPASGGGDKTCKISERWKWQNLLDRYAVGVTRWMTALLASVLLISSHVAASELEGFTEPYRQVAVPAAEIGVLAEVLVAEGDQVLQQQLLARVDDSVLQASLEVARAAKDAMGARRGAETELEVREKQRDSYQELFGQGNATQRELDRIESEYQQAAARLQTVREELDIRRLEFERVKSQIRQRRIESPINGHVVAIVKEAGEFVSPTDPVVMHIVQLDVLKAVFSVPLELAGELRPRQSVTLLVGSSRAGCPGIIEFVSPTADAQSASVRVKIRIPNANGDIPSGAACHWDLDQAADELQQQVTKRPTARVR